MSCLPHYPVDGIQSQDFWRPYPQPPLAIYNLDIDLRLVIFYLIMIWKIDSDIDISELVGISGEGEFNN